MIPSSGESEAVSTAWTLRSSMRACPTDIQDMRISNRRLNCFRFIIVPVLPELEEAVALSGLRSDFKVTNTGRYKTSTRCAPDWPEHPYVQHTQPLCKLSQG